MQREPGKYYLEADPAPWAWLLGDGVAEGVNCWASPHRPFWGDPAASLTLGDMLPQGLIKASQFRNSRWPEKQAICERLADRIGTAGLFIGVPVNRCAPTLFVERVERRGVLQAVNRGVAQTVARSVPFTAIYTSRRMPVFRDEYHRRGARTLAGELVFAVGVVDATWLRPDWGLGPEDDKGDDHYMRPVLRVIERLDREWETLAEREEWRRAKQFFGATRFDGQPFGAARIARVVYVARGDEPEKRLAADAALGIQIIEIESVPCIPL